ncbi:hypothetical protein LTR36_006687 [Oleoguttula mirabilis]|uniref:Uncharacterized protein n=1 Tax=Oleoguttula mirabilis TaxID=1507867 RepID=A0AAV9JCA8_9PEZI|nr:hypothetical protein LTR36_006687 [Oleoguttula mirabilis]
MLFGWTVTPKSAHSQQDAVLAVSGVSPGSWDDTNALVLGKVTLAYTVGASSSGLFSSERVPRLAEVNDAAKIPGSKEFRTTISSPDAQRPVCTAPIAGTLQEGVVSQKIEGKITASSDVFFYWELRMSSTPNNRLAYDPSLPLVLHQNVGVKIEIAGKIAAKGKATLTMTEYWYDSDTTKPGVAGALRESIVTKLDVQKEYQLGIGQAGLIANMGVWPVSFSVVFSDVSGTCSLVNDLSYQSPDEVVSLLLFLRMVQEAIMFAQVDGLHIAGHAPYERTADNAGSGA